MVAFVMIGRVRQPTLRTHAKAIWESDTGARTVEIPDAADKQRQDRSTHDSRAQNSREWSIAVRRPNLMPAKPAPATSSKPEEVIGAGLPEMKKRESFQRSSETRFL